jgi:pyrroloquinoline quinone (PQQ) biosynthesis protein C
VSGPDARCGQRLRALLRLAGPALAAASERFWNHPRLAEMFPSFLIRAYWVARASVGLMEAALRRARTLAPADAVSTRLAQYYERHLAEERDHPGWLLADLETLGVDRSRTLSTVPTPAIAVLVGPHHVWVESGHPVAALGHLAVLEGHPPSARELERVRERTGLSHEAFRFLRAHAEIDPHHAADLFGLLDELPLDRVQSSLVGLSALHTVGAVAGVFEELIGDDSIALVPAAVAEVQ